MGLCMNDSGPDLGTLAFNESQNLRSRIDFLEKSLIDTQNQLNRLISTTNTLANHIKLLAGITNE